MADVRLTANHHQPSLPRGRDGFSVVRSIREMPPLVVLIGIMYVVRGAEMALRVYVVRDLLDASVDDIGLFGGAIGLGALVATPLAARTASSQSAVRPILASLVLTAIPTAAPAVITQTVWACAVLVCVGARSGMVVFVFVFVFEVVIVVMVMLVRVTPAESLGRVFGAINGASNTSKLARAVAGRAARRSSRDGDRVADAMLRCMPGDAFLPVLEHAGSAPSALLDGIANRLASHR